MAESSPLIGRTISHYRILEKLGGGGMGVVYKAQDLRLHRFVALKFLPEETSHDLHAVEQLRREARAASALNHPHICTVHDIDEHDGQPFIVMELLEGQTLKHRLSGGSLDTAEIVSLGIQIVDALDAAHARDIIHRDIKPANIFVTLRGQVKVLDFGLAKVLPAETASTLAAGIEETQALVGTLPYMAPEQLQGRGVSTCTDIYAVGTVLYEMATGRRPFTEEFAPELMQSIQHAQPPRPRELNPAVSSSLETVILKCLEKDAQKRYHRMQQLLQDLRRLLPSTAFKRRRLLFGAASLVGLALVAAVVVLAWRIQTARQPANDLRPSIRSIAVLPLENLSHDSEQEYFAEGLTEELTTDLAKIGALRVISRTSAMRYKGTNKSSPEIARELNVDGIIEGSVQRSGNRVRITTQLIHAPTDTHMWADSFERDIGNLLALQEEVARAIASELKVTLTPEERTLLAGARPVDSEAQDFYLKGRYYWNKRTPDTLKKSLEYFQQAVEKDPAYALAYAGLADSYLMLGAGLYAVLPPKDAYPKAEAAAIKALQLDNTLAEAHSTLGYSKLVFDWDWHGAEQEFRQAIELNPSYANAHHWYAGYLGVMGRYSEAIVEGRKAESLDPLSLIISADVAMEALAPAGLYDQALEQCRKTLEMDPNFAVAHACMSDSYLGKGMYKEAITEMQKAKDLSGGSIVWVSALGSIYAMAGNRNAALGSLNELRARSKREFVGSERYASIYAALGNKDQAFAWFERAYEDRSDILFDIRLYQVYRPLRSDPRVQDLLRRVGLPP
jgi:serine/threonine protein kinase/Flp pilus assembly protein TadD